MSLHIITNFNKIMKKIFPVLIYLFASSLFGQTWIDVSFKGGVGPDLLINLNVLEDVDLVHKFSVGNTFAGKFGVNFGDIHSINFEVASTKFRQSFDFRADDVLPGQEMSFNSIDYSFLYRKLSDGRYLEIGPTVSTTSEGSISSPNFGGIFGFGRTIAGSDKIAINIGARFRYIATDLLNDSDGSESLYFSKAYAEYKISTPLSFMFMVEIDWAVGVFGRSNCYSRRLRFVTF